MDPAWLDAVVLLTTGPHLCTGSIVEPTGTVLTAYHCVAIGIRPRVRTHDGRELVGRLIAADVAMDLALVEVPALGPAAPTLTLATADPAQGAELWAVGHPFAAAASGALEGTLLWSVSRGVVSAVGEAFVQTDAALNPGNSGGPLLDTDGRLVGVVSRKLSADNISFATRVSYASALLVNRAPAPLLGGGWGLAAVLTPTHDRGYALGAELELVARERLWTRLQVGGVLGETPAPHAKLALGLRQRLGHGPLSTALDLGGAVTLAEPLDPELDARLTAVGVGLGAIWAPVSGAWGVELAATLPFRGAW
ncbi:MAG: serine protease [Myxococcales bacterium]|nr:serine protease [Myxococcales bacterium]